MNTALLLADAANAAAGTFFGLGIFGLVVALVLFLFSAWMFIDALTNASLNQTMKIVWALVIFFAPFLGAVAYFVVARSPGTRMKGI